MIVGSWWQLLHMLMFDHQLSCSSIHFELIPMFFPATHLGSITSRCSGKEPALLEPTTHSEVLANGTIKIKYGNNCPVDKKALVVDWSSADKECEWTPKSSTNLDSREKTAERNAKGNWIGKQER